MVAMATKGLEEARVLQAMRSATARRYTAPPPDCMRDNV
jgi:hypothetical protein